MGLNYNNADTIKHQISMYQRYPEDLFVGSPELLRTIELRIQPRLATSTSIDRAVPFT